MRISDWSSDVCSSDLITGTTTGATAPPGQTPPPRGRRGGGERRGRSCLCPSSPKARGKQGEGRFPLAGSGRPGGLQTDPQARAEGPADMVLLLLRGDFAADLEGPVDGHAAPPGDPAPLEIGNASGGEGGC